MSLVISPLQAAAILLPILCVQDLISIYSYRNSFHLKNLQILIPAAILGIFAGYLWFSLLSEQNIKILLGLIAIIFSLNYFFFSDTLKKGSISFSKGTLLLDFQIRPFKGAAAWDVATFRFHHPKLQRL